MALIYEMRRQGDWLFKNRTWLPMVLLPPAAYLMWLSPTPPWGLSSPIWLGVCFLVVLLGLAIRAYAVGHAPIGTSGRNTSEGQIAIRVNKTGLYSVVRHPLYLGNFLMWLGVVLMPSHFEFTVFFVLAFYLYYERIMFAEEAFLREKFGAEYEEWAKSVPAFWPRWQSWQPPDYPVQWKVIIRQEYLGLCTAIVLLCGLGYLGAAAQAGQWVFPQYINLFLSIGLLLFVIIRFLAKKTQTLALSNS